MATISFEAGGWTNYILPEEWDAFEAAKGDNVHIFRPIHEDYIPHIKAIANWKMRKPYEVLRLATANAHLAKNHAEDLLYYATRDSAAEGE